MNKSSQKKAFTLVEILVAISLFSAVAMMALTVFVNIMRIQNRLSMENAIYEDARFMMERISREIRNNAIDYEEYYNKALGKNYGTLYGCYAARFYNPGHGIVGGSLTEFPGELGALCNTGEAYNGQDCVVYKPSIDLNTGEFPFKGASQLVTPPTAQEAMSNAFCPLFSNSSSLTCSPNDGNNKQTELYLINRSGTVKTMLARKKVAVVNGMDQNALAMVEKTGEDNNLDGLTEKWTGCSGNTLCCASGFDCPNTLTSLESSLDGVTNGIYTGFVPLSPLRSNLTRLDFQIVPGEDPRKAFDEPAVVYQPMVRVVLSVQPSADQLAKFGNPTGNEIPTIVLQTTISSRIQNEVKSYLGSDTYKTITAAGCNL